MKKNNSIVAKKGDIYMALVPDITEGNLLSGIVPVVIISNNHIYPVTYINI